MIYTNGLNFNITTVIPEILSKEPTTDQLVIKKLSERVAELEDKVTSLEKYNETLKICNEFVDNMEIPIYRCNYTDQSNRTLEMSINIPVKCYDMIVTYAAVGFPYNSRSGNTYNITSSTMSLFNNNFAKVKMHRLTIYGNFPTPSYHAPYLPQNLSELTISQAGEFKSFSGICACKNLKVLRFENCPKLTNIYDFVQGVKVDEIQVINCPSVQDYSLLESKGYKVTR